MYVGAIAESAKEIVRDYEPLKKNNNFETGFDSFIHDWRMHQLEGGGAFYEQRRERFQEAYNHIVKWEELCKENGRLCVPSSEQRESLWMFGLTN